MIEIQEDIFPYPHPTPDQKVIMSTIENLEKHGTLMLEADTGTGKTIAVLTALYHRRQVGQKILLVVRTINQMNSFLREWRKLTRKINETGGKPLWVVPILGKKRVCQNNCITNSRTLISCHGGFEDLTYFRKERVLRKLTAKNHRHRLIKLVNNQLLDGDCTVSEYIDIMRTYENCVYYNLLSLIRSADIIILSYAYLDPNLLKRLQRIGKFDISDTLLVIDEAHNLAYERFLEVSKIELENIRSLFGTHPWLEKSLREMRGVRILDPSDLSLPKEKLPFHGYIQQCKRYDLEKVFLAVGIVPTKEIIAEIREIIHRLDEMYYKIQNIRKRGSEYHMIVTPHKLLLYSPNYASWLRNLRGSQLLILQSATLSPIRYFRKYLELPVETKYIELVEQDMRKIRQRSNELRLSYVSSISSRSLYRNQHLYQRYAKLILEVVAHSPKHSLILGPSYEFIDVLDSELQAQMQLNGKSYEMVKESARSSSDVIHGHIMAMTSPGIILGNQLGKIMEGNEWVREGESVISLVILSGLSVGIPRDEQHVLDRIKLQTCGDGRVAELFTQQIPLQIAARQGFGRAIRSKKDKAVLLIFDDRVDEYLHRQLVLTRLNKMNILSEKIQNFFGLSFPSLTNLRQ